MRIWKLVFALVLFTVIGDVAWAQTPRRPASQQTTNNTRRANVENGTERFAYEGPGNSPFLTVAELKATFGRTQLDAEDFADLVSGAKGNFASRYNVGIARSILGSDTTPQPLIDEIVRKLRVGEYEQDVIRGLDCKSEVRTGIKYIVGDCDFRINGPLTYWVAARRAVGYTELPPVPIGHDIHVVIVDGIEIPSGYANAGKLGRVAFIRYFRERNRAGNVVDVPTCAQPMGIIEEPPPPPQVSVAPPPPPPPPPPAIQVPPQTATVAPQPPPTATPFAIKLFTNGDGKRLSKLPNDWQKKLKMRGIGVSGTAYVPTYTPIEGTYTELDGDKAKFMAVLVSFADVPLSEGRLTVSELEEFRGFRDITKSLLLPDISQYELRQLPTDASEEKQVYINEDKPCRLLGMPCWVPPIIAGGVACAIVCRPGETTVPPRVPINPGKTGGPGNSP